MASLNKVILIGNLGRDAELTCTATGRHRLSFSLATNESYQDREGQWQTETDWHRVVAWGDLAKSRGDLLKRGRQVLVEGRIRTRSYDDAGVKKYITEVNAARLALLGPRPEDGDEEPKEAESPF